MDLFLLHWLVATSSGLLPILSCSCPVSFSWPSLTLFWFLSYKSVSRAGLVSRMDQPCP